MSISGRIQTQTSATQAVCFNTVLMASHIELAQRELPKSLKRLVHLWVPTILRMGLMQKILDQMQITENLNVVA